MKELTSERMKENSIYISVVIPLYNKQNSIVATLQSVLAQTYTNFEVIVVDDGSTDDSANVAEAVLRECTVYGVECKGKVIRKANGGVCSARNRGIQEAKYDYIALLDGDDLWNEHYLEEQVKLIQDFPEAKMWGVNYFGTSHADLFCSSSVVLTKEIAQAVGMQDERMAYSEDLDFWYRIILHAKVVYYDKVLAYYNKDAENRAEQNFHAHFDIKRRMEYYIDKYLPYFAENPSFARYISLRAAWLILQEGYYFGDKYDREATDKIIKYLAYEHMPYKYGLIFRTPRFIGRMVYELTKLLKKIKS